MNKIKKHQSFVCSKNSDELEGIRGVIKEVRKGEEKETENAGEFEIIAELFPTEEQRKKVNSSFPFLEFGFGFEEVVLSEDEIIIT